MKREKWNRKLAACSLTAFMAVVLGTGFGVTACAETVIDNDQEVQAVQEVVPESENKGALPEENPAADAAGEAGFEVMKVVVIEEEQVPGAAKPELTGEEVSEPGAEEVEVPSEEAAEEPAKGEAQTPETAGETSVPEEVQNRFAGTLNYDDSEVSVTVTVSEEAQLPADTRVQVKKLEKGSAKYEAAKAAASQSLEADEDADYTFYDVTLESEGQVLTVKEGTVSVRMEFRTEGSEIVKIEETENGKVARNVTDRAAEGRTGSVEMSY